MIAFIKRFLALMIVSAVLGATLGLLFKFPLAWVVLLSGGLGVGIPVSVWALRKFVFGSTPLKEKISE